MYRDTYSHLDQWVCIDHVVMTPARYQHTSVSYILTMQDSWTWYLVAAPVTATDAATTAKAIFYNWILQFGVCEPRGRPCIWGFSRHHGNLRYNPQKLYPCIFTPRQSSEVRPWCYQKKDLEVWHHWGRKSALRCVCLQNFHQQGDRSQRLLQFIWKESSSTRRSSCSLTQG